jgi:hypothetical protein
MREFATGDPHARRCGVVNTPLPFARIRAAAWSFLLFGVSLIALAGCGGDAVETPDVIVLQTGRLRGNVVPLELQANAPLQHYPFLAGYVRDVRNEAAATGARVLLVDLGDSLGGSFASHATASENMIAFFNTLGYDAIALSNLDFGANPEMLGRIEAPVINPFSDSDGQPATPGSNFMTSMDKDGIPVRIMANFYGDTARDEFPGRFPTRFGASEGPVVPVRDHAAVARAAGPEPAGALSLLTWMKFESPEVVPEVFLESLRGAGIDAILAHRIYGGGRVDGWNDGGIIPWSPPVSLNILRNNGGFALARLDLKRDGDGWRVLNHALVPMTANTAQPDEEIVQRIAAFAPVIAAADTPVAELPKPLDQQAILRATMECLATVPGTDAALYSKDSIRSDWPGGPLTASRVFNSLPWTTPVVQVSLSRGQLDEALAIPGMRALLRPGAPEQTLVVTTSEFFGKMLAQRLGLPSGAVRRVADMPVEFDFYVRAFAADPHLLEGEGESGWEELAAANGEGSGTP